MNVFELYATLSLNSSGFEQGLKNAEGGMGKALQGMMKTLAGLKLLEAGFQKVGDIVKKSVGNYAEYEQLVGGIETLFKKSAGKVQKYAQQAYKTAGMSANEYMSLATDFSASLISAVGGNTEKAATLVDRAIQDMSDNSNKMGTDIQSIKNAYRGFAKENYTMLDNLKLGYGGTKEEMLRLVNDSGIFEKKLKNLDNVSFADIIKAIGKVQDKLGITGTTAKEAATTIEGSGKAMKAAWENLLTEMATGDGSAFDTKMQEFTTSFSTYMSNLLPVAVTAIGGSGGLIAGLFDAVTTIDPQIVTQAATNLTTSLSTIVGSLGNVGDWVLDTIADAMTNEQLTVDSSSKLGDAIGGAIGDLLTSLMDNAPAILQGVGTFAISLGGSLIEKIAQSLVGDIDGKSPAEIIATALESIFGSTEEGTGLLGFGSKIIGVFETLFTDILAALGVDTGTITEIQGVLDSIINPFVTAVQGAINLVKSLLKGDFEAAGAAAWDALTAPVIAVFDGVYKTVTLAINAVRRFLGLGDASEEQAKYWADVAENAMPNAGDNVKAYLDGYFDSAGFDNDTVRDYLWDRLWSPNEISDNAKPLQDMLGLDDTAFADFQQQVSEAIGQGIINKENFDDPESWDFSAAGTAVESAITTSGEAAMKTITGGDYHVDLKVDAVQGTGWNGLGLSGKMFPRHATGENYVPYDNYAALLHKGEAVLNAAEARKWRSRGQMGSTYNDTNTLYVGNMYMSSEWDVERLQNEMRTMTRRRNAGFGVS